MEKPSKTEIVKRMNELQDELKPVRAFVQARLNELTKLECMLNEAKQVYENEELDAITKVVCDYYGTTIQELRLPKRNEETKKPKQIAIYFIKEKYKMKYSTVTIARYFCLVSHATVLNALKKFTDYYETDIQYRHETDEIRNLLKENYLL